jgi:hypothetical protein
MDRHRSRHRPDQAGLVEPTLRGVLAAGVRSIGFAPGHWVGAFVALLVAQFVFSGASLLFEISVPLVHGMLRLVVLVLVTACMVPTVWGAQLGRRIDGFQLGRAMGQRVRTLASFAAGLAVSLFVVSVVFAYGVAPLLDEAGLGDGGFGALVGLLVILAVLRAGPAILVAPPVSVVEKTGWVDSIRRSWRLSAAPWVLIGVLGVVAALPYVVVFVVFGGVGAETAAGWQFQTVVVPIVAALLDLGWVAVAGPAYAAARHRAEGYSVEDANADLLAMLAGTSAR